MTKLETQAIHAGHQVDPTTGAITPPIHLSTTFERQPDGAYPHGYYYARSDNPNRHALEASLAELEGGVEAAAFASGSGAVMTILQALAPGDHVIAPDDLYFGIRLLLQDVFTPWGLAVNFVDTTNLAAVKQALQTNTRLVLIETPSNPLLKITDIRGLAGLAHEVGACLVCDNTIATPVLQRPLDLGADLVIHATTKYLGGHSDVLGGLVVAKANNELWQKIKHIRQIGGAVPSPFECWLALRGIQTLPYRVRAQADTARQVAQFLQTHPAVEAVHYPGLPSHPGHPVAAGQMEKFGGLFSFQVKGGQAEAMAVAARVKIFIRATSFGGTHSLIEHRASIEAPGTTTPENLLRASIGLENVDDLIEDLDQALD
ncbi:MAG: aminotransferase class V-fold PLP-dependent enzyme [Anaerolineae bacterium]|nr:aminotransferase class V-fold PLP-dependent enzyme [Anaerolineae bacterium]